jgi:hypothetical protein
MHSGVNMKSGFMLGIMIFNLCSLAHANPPPRPVIMPRPTPIVKTFAPNGGIPIYVVTPNFIGKAG